MLVYPPAGPSYLRLDLVFAGADEVEHERNHHHERYRGSGEDTRAEASALLVERTQHRDAHAPRDDEAGEGSCDESPSECFVFPFDDHDDADDGEDRGRNE